MGSDSTRLQLDVIRQNTGQTRLLRSVKNEFDSALLIKTTSMKVRNEKILDCGLGKTSSRQLAAVMAQGITYSASI